MMIKRLRIVKFVVVDELLNAVVEMVEELGIYK